MESHAALHKGRLHRRPVDYRMSDNRDKRLITMKMGSFGLSPQTTDCCPLGVRYLLLTVHPGTARPLFLKQLMGNAHTKAINEQLEQDRVYPSGPLYSLGWLLSRVSLP